MLCDVLIQVGKKITVSRKGREKPEASQNISEGEKDKEFGERREWSKALVGSLNPLAYLSSSMHASPPFQH